MFLIENVVLNKDDAELLFIASDGRELKFELIGDCCSTSYFDEESKVDAASLLGHTLRSWEVSSVGRLPLSGDGERQLYMLVVRTDKASISLSWRNDSNG